MTSDSAPFRLAQLEALERSHDVFNMTVDGIAPWELARFEVARSLRRELTGGGAIHDTPEGMAAMLQAGKLALKNLLQRNPYRAAPADICVVGHPRRQRGPDGRWWDIYCDPLFADSDYEVAHFEFSDFLTHRRPPKTPDLRYLDLIDIPGIAAAELPVPLSRRLQQTVEQFASVESAIEADFGVHVNVQQFVAGELRRRAVLRPLYDRLLRRVDPELLVLVVNYGRGMKILIEVAKALQIPVIELQHGVINASHPGYDHPVNVEADLFPDWLWTFGSFWATQAEIPISAGRVHPVGFPWLERQFERHAAVRTRDQLLFISQSRVGEALSRLAVACAADTRISDVVIYKLHPDEANRWRERYPWLRHSGVTVIDGQSPSLHELFAQSRAQVGVGSTAVYEGLCFDLETYVYDIGGARTLMPLVDAGAAEVIDSVDALAAQLGRGAGSFDREYYFAADALPRMRETLERLMASGTV